MATAPASFTQLSQMASANQARQRADANQDSLRETARQFEAMFVKQLLDQVDLAGSFGGAENAQSDFVNSMWRDKISEQMTQGEGLGLASMLVRQLGGEASAGGAAMPKRSLVNLQAAGPKLYDIYGSAPAGFGSREEFVTELKPHLEKAAGELGVSPRVLLAQAALETGWGEHMPQSNDGRPSHNLFGIKADAGWQGPAAVSRTTEVIEGEEQQVTAGFRQYQSIAESVRDYVDFLKTNPRYEPALSHGGSDENFLQGLKFAGYATDPQYVEKVISVADSPSMSRYWNEI